MKIFRCESCCDRGSVGNHDSSCIIIVDENAFANPNNCKPDICPYGMDDEQEWREITC